MRRATRLALALFTGALVSLALAPAGLAAAPAAGLNCQAQDGKISGRGSTLQTWLQYDLMGAYASDICGSVASQATTYTGPTGDGGSITFTVASDGTIVDTYEISGAHGTDEHGNGCVFNAQADAGLWPGAPIANGTFSYQVGTAIDIQGTLSGSQSASGTLALDDPPEGSSPGCNTGTVNWTATLTSNPPADALGGDITHPLSAIWNLTGGSTYDQNWMTAYNYTDAQILGSAGANSAVGSSAGLSAIGCRAEAFGGTDIPVTTGQLSAIDGAVPAPGGTSNGVNCDPFGSQALVSQFTPLPTPNFPNAGDQTTHNGAMVFPIGISAVSVFANLPTSCLPSSGGVQLTTSDMENIWGGTWTNWDQVPASDGIVQPCNLAITRVVPSDNSGTTQALDNYMADAFGYTAATCQTSSATAGTFKELQNNEATNGTNVNWPGGPPNATPPAGCSPVIAAPGAGAAALVALALTTNGAVGFADYADALNDTSNFTSQVGGNAIAQFGLEASTGATDVQPDIQGSGIGASNCAPTLALPSGGSSGAVGLGGKWDLTAQTQPNQGEDDIAFAREGSTYPICSLTWDLVWTGEEGNTPPTPTTTGYSAGATSIPLSSAAGVPNMGTFTVSASDGSDRVSYTAISGTSLTGVTGDTGTVTSGATLAFPQGTGGPEADLTADQRRTLYSYFTYVMSPGAQNSELTAGYAPLPSVWLSTIRSGFQANF